MKSVSQIAKENGVSVQTIYRKLNSVKHESDECLTSKRSGITYISTKGEELIIDSLTSVKQVLNSVEQVFNTIKPLDSEEVVFLREHINKLQSELDKEREHSREQAKRLSDISEQMADLTRNSQILLKQQQEKNSFILEACDEQVSRNQDKQCDQVNHNQKDIKSFWKFWKRE